MDEDNNSLQMLGSPWVIIINLASHVCRQNNRIQTGLWGADLSHWSRAASRKMGFPSHLTVLWCGRRQSMETCCLTGLPPALNTASRDGLPSLWSMFSLELGISHPRRLLPWRWASACRATDLLCALCQCTEPHFALRIGFLKCLSRLNVHIL